MWSTMQVVRPMAPPPADRRDSQLAGTRHFSNLWEERRKISHCPQTCEFQVRGIAPIPIAHLATRPEDLQHGSIPRGLRATVGRALWVRTSSWNSARYLSRRAKTVAFVVMSCTPRPVRL